MSAPFRIVRGVRKPGAGEDFKQYLDRLLKMIPAEVVGLYIVGNGFIPPDKAIGSVVWFVICLILVIIVRIYGTADGPGKPPQPFPVLISAGAFVIWVYSLGGPFAKYNLHIPYIGSLAVLVWSFVIPVFYQGPAPSDEETN